VDVQSCPTDDDVAGYVAGELAASDHRVVTVHLDGCERCRRLVSALAGTEPTLASDDPAAASRALGGGAGVQVGRFSLVRLLGRGAMGEVWAARDPELSREVAIKLVQFDGHNDRAELRFRREAQAMARLNHPNVVKIYELGTAGDDLAFCAMELIDGVTLRSWLAQPRDWREVIAIAGAVGRGLAGAHAAGLVHRDIKPENILIAADGRTLVSDFGLARLLDDNEQDNDDAAGTIGDLGFTAAGAVIGTPLYMAPEQLAGRDVDARSDQFAYCVTIYEALFGARPFDGDTLDELARAIDRGPPRPAEVGGVPRGIVRALARGLATDPDARWPAMAPLVAEIEHAAGAPRRRKFALLVGVVAAAAAVAATWLAVPASRAESPEARIDRAWNPEKAVAMRVAFAATGAPLADENALMVGRALDDYRAAWIAQRSSVRLDPALASRQLACFDRLADALDRLVTLLSKPARGDVARGASSAYRLEPPAWCSDAERVAATSIAPSTWAGRVAAFQLTQLESLQVAGHRSEALRAATALVAEAQRDGEPMLLARARYDLGAAQSNMGKPADAAATLRLAIQDAAAARDHYLVAAAWMRLFDVTGFALARTADAEAMEPAVRAAVAQAGNDPNQLADLEMDLGLVAYGRHDMAGARDHFTVARERRIAARGPDHPIVGNDDINLAGVLLELGQLDDASTYLERGTAIIRARFGDHHPLLANAEQNLAAIAARRKQWPASEQHARAALAIALPTFGADSSEAANIRVVLAHALREQQRYDDARAQLELARTARAKTLPPTHRDRITIDLEVALVDASQGDYATALTLANGAVDRLRAANVAPAVLAVALAHLADITAHVSPARALPIYDEALRLSERNATNDVSELRDLATTAIAAKQPAIALAWFARLPNAAEQLPDLRAQLEHAK
jgi:eukaryotic-like serine/threonine-protein kinase